MSRLQLNEPEKYKAFPSSGKAPIIEQMPLLIAEGRIPLSVNGLLKRKLEVLTASEAVKFAYWYNYFDTGDAIAYHPDGRVKIVLDSQDLRQVTPESTLSLGALVLPNGRYEQLQGEEFTREQINKHTGKPLTKEQAKANPIWQALAREKLLLEQYVDEVFSQAKSRFDYDKNMGLFVSFSSPQNKPYLRPLCVSRLDYGSGADVRGRLNGSSRLVGVRS